MDDATPKAEPTETKPKRRRAAKVTASASNAANAATSDATVAGVEAAAASETRSKRRRGVPEASSPDALARMKRQKGEGTKPEIVLQEALRAQGLEFEVQAKVVPGVRRKADIVFREKKIAIFVDGCFWHACPVHATWPKANADWWREKIEANQRRDRDTDKRLEEAGWKVVRVWECEADATPAVLWARAMRQDNDTPADK